MNNRALEGTPNELDCLRALRAELSASYPRIRPDRLIRIARAAGLSQFPAGFLISGSLTGFRSEARATLAAAQRTQTGVAADLHPLFSQAHYLLTNPDVAGAGVAPWAHYQVYGRAEGRSPHPLIDTSFLAAWLPDTPPQNVFDRYLSDADLWVADPGPYIDCRKFMLYGNWDGVTNPVLQIVRDQLGSHWVHRRLMLVDAASKVAEVARLTGVGYLLSQSPARARLATLRSWRPGTTPAEGHDLTVLPDLTVVPGYFLGSNGSTLSAISRAVVSPDSTFIALPTEHLSIETGETVETSQLVFLERDYDVDALRELLENVAPGAAIAPFTVNQQSATEYLAHAVSRPDVRVLAVGRQVTVRGAVLLTPPAMQSLQKTRVLDEGDAREVAIVLRESEWQRATAEPALATLITQGAALCLIGSLGIPVWLPVLSSRKRIASEPQTLASLGAFLPQTMLYTLPAQSEPTE